MKERESDMSLTEGRWQVDDRSMVGRLAAHEIDMKGMQSKGGRCQGDMKAMGVA